jgi:hypothetical protein
MPAINTEHARGNEKYVHIFGRKNLKITEHVGDLGIYLRLTLTEPYRKCGMKMWDGLNVKAQQFIFVNMVTHFLAP